MLTTILGYVYQLWTIVLFVIIKKYIEMFRGLVFVRVTLLSNIVQPFKTQSHYY